MSIKDKNILIIGLGLIGGSYAAKLSKEGLKVYGIDSNPDSVSYAVEHGYIRDTLRNENELVSSADIIIFTVYPHIVPDLVEKYSPYFKKDVLLTDVSGVKGEMLSRVNEIISGKYRYISHHPMAGKETNGIQNADEDLFHDANFIIIKDDDENTEELEELARTLEFKNISYLSSKEHDTIIGYLSQLTHAIAISLMNARNTDSMIEYTGDSFRDLTRIAVINEKMWSELFLENKESLISEIDQFAKSLEDLKACLIHEDRDKLEQLMISSTERRKKFGKRNRK